MKDRWLAYVPILLMAGLAALTYWLDQVVEPLAQPRDGSQRHDPDIVVENVSAMQMALSGSPRYAVVAKRMLHYPDDRTTVLELPQLTHYDKSSVPVTIRSDTGELSPDGKEAVFRGNVLVRKPASSEDPEMTLATSLLHVIPDQDLAHTDREVTLTRGDSTVRSVGLEFDHATRNLRLLSRVRGTFQTPEKGQALPWERRR